MIDETSLRLARCTQSTNLSAQGRMLLALFVCACSSTTTTNSQPEPREIGGKGNAGTSGVTASGDGGMRAGGGAASNPSGGTSAGPLGGAAGSTVATLGGASTMGGTGDAPKGGRTNAGASSVGGTQTAGGSVQAGGVASGAGTASIVGGSIAIGGRSSTAAGGSPGGANASGGIANGGSSNSGGTNASGGAVASGGTQPSGGTAASGGSTSNPCAPNPCKNAGTCSVNGSGAAVCQYVSGWVGNTCGDKLFEGLGRFADRTESRATGITADGMTVVGVASNGAGVDDVALQWKASIGLRKLQCVDTTQASIAHGISGDGTAVVGMCRATEWIATVWSGGVWNKWLQTGFSGNDADAEAYAVNGNGTVIGGYHSAAAGSDYPNAVIWDATGRHIITWTGDGYESYVNAISDVGTVAAGQTIEEPSTAVRFTLSGTTWTAEVLPTLTGGTSGGAAHGISRDGMVIVGASSTTAVRWVNGVPSTLWTGGHGKATNSDGNVVVGWNGTTAMIWTSAGGSKLLFDVLDAAGAQGLGEWTLTEANAISANGKIIVGNGIHNGAVEAFIARLP